MEEHQERIKARADDYLKAPNNTILRGKTIMQKDNASNLLQDILTLRRQLNKGIITQRQYVRGTDKLLEEADDETISRFDELEQTFNDGEIDSEEYEKRLAAIFLQGETEKTVPSQAAEVAVNAALPMKTNDKYDVFISYRRNGGFETAKLVYYSLQQKGYRVFMDVEALRSGPFNKQLYDVIDSASDFVLILSKNALERCKNNGDWVREEILRAMKSDKNIIPIIQNDFSFPESMPSEMKGLEYYNGVVSSVDYFDAAINKLETMLKAKPYSQAQRTEDTNSDFTKVAKIIQILLRAKDFEAATKNCQEALATYKDKAILYVFKMLAEAKMKDESELYLYPREKIENIPSFQVAMALADESEKIKFKEIIDQHDLICEDLKNITNCVCDYIRPRIDEINDCIHQYASPKLNTELYAFLLEVIQKPQYISLEITYPELKPFHYATSKYLMTNSFSINIYLTIHDDFNVFLQKETIDNISQKVLDILRDGINKYNHIPNENISYIFREYNKYNPRVQNQESLKITWGNANVTKVRQTIDNKTYVVFISLGNMQFIDNSKCDSPNPPSKA